MTDFLETILRRRSIRQFTPQPLSEDQLAQLVEAGMSAPSAMNSQPWEFVVVTDPEILKKLHLATLFSSQNYTAVICVCGSRRAQKNKAGDRFWVQDCSAAAENILLGATSLGLGGVWIGVYPVTLFIRSVRTTLNLPEDVTPLCLLGLGYPAEEKEPHRDFDGKRIHWQIYEPIKPKGARLFKIRKNEKLLEDVKKK